MCRDRRCRRITRTSCVGRNACSGRTASTACVPSSTRARRSSRDPPRAPHPHPAPPTPTPRPPPPPLHLGPPSDRVALVRPQRRFTRSTDVFRSVSPSSRLLIRQVAVRKRSTKKNWRQRVAFARNWSASRSMCVSW